MYALFWSASSFNGDISKWDVFNVANTDHMFAGAASFDADISKWDVSSVTNMNQMFENTAAFKQQLVHSKATKDSMFEGSDGSIASRLLRSLVACDAAVFSPQSNAALQNAVDACLKLSPEGDCSNGPNGPVTRWDASRVPDMNSIFRDTESFSSDISKWDVSKATDTKLMFFYT